MEPADTEDRLAMPFCKRDLSIQGCWYPWGSWNQSSTVTEGWLSHSCPGRGHITSQRWLWCLSSGEEKSKEMQGEQFLNLNQNSFILWSPEETESMWVHRAINLGFTDMHKKDPKPIWVESIRALAGCRVVVWQKWVRKGVLLQQGAAPTVPLEAQLLKHHMRNVRTRSECLWTTEI